METPLVSILMPAYNTEKYISEAIESVLKQTYTNWELIICDDCSTDNLYEIALNYSEQDSRIKVIKNSKNMRQAFSRNHAFKISQGTYIAILDSDDRIDEKRLEEQINFLQKNPSFAFVGTNASMFNDEKNIFGYISKKQFPTPLDVIRNKGFVYGTIVVRRRAFEDVGGYTVSDITKTSEDYDFVCKLYSLNYKGANINNYLYEYRVIEAYKRRVYQCYIDEFKVGMSHIRNGWLSLNGVPLIYAFFICLPLLKGLIPQSIIQQYHKIRFRRNV